MDMDTFPMTVISITTTIRGSRPEVVAACLVMMALDLTFQKYLGEGMIAGSVNG
ncbi:ABC-type sugar transport system, permease component [Candidatus Moduliflexus flocculans]|uniref:ABC-type sugar transport system, permease component n=1 Tax=Candidatus Moduliflexus flocculans TaxID=1499966 RepID=A0A0S6VQA2_9BACT|nr:ABC-type sugar transport system, permease component [Candidatus Moduliflexus flocculans]